jgi:hypothetical protein
LLLTPITVEFALDTVARSDVRQHSTRTDPLELLKVLAFHDKLKQKEVIVEAWMRRCELDAIADKLFCATDDAGTLELRGDLCNMFFKVGPADDTTPLKDLLIFGCMQMASIKIKAHNSC